jgi:hypothetical protein
LFVWAGRVGEEPMDELNRHTPLNRIRQGRAVPLPDAVELPPGRLDRLGALGRLQRSA